MENIQFIKSSPAPKLSSDSPSLKASSDSIAYAKEAVGAGSSKNSVKAAAVALVAGAALAGTAKAAAGAMAVQPRAPDAQAGAQTQAQVLDKNQQVVATVAVNPRAIEQALGNLKTQGKDAAGVAPEQSEASGVVGKATAVAKQSVQTAMSVKGTTLAVLSKEGKKLLETAESYRKEIALRITDLQEGKLDAIAAVVLNDERLFTQVMPLLAGGTKVAAWLVTKYEQMTGHKVVEAAQLKAVAKELVTELKGMLAKVKLLIGAITGGRVDLKIIKETLRIFGHELHQLKLKVDNNMVQQLALKVGNIGKVALGNSISSERLKESAARSESGFFTVAAAAVDPRETLVKMLDSLRETDHVGKKEELKSAAVLISGLGFEVLKLANPEIYAIQAAGPIAGRIAGNIALQVGAEIQTAGNWETWVGNIAFYVSLGTNVAGSLGKGVILGAGFFAVSRGTEKAAGMAIERGASESLTNLVADSLWIPLAIVGAKGMEKAEPGFAKLMHRIGESDLPGVKLYNHWDFSRKAEKFANASIDSQVAAWKFDLKEKGMVDNEALWREELAGEKLPGLFHEAPAARVDEATSGELLLREIQKGNAGTNKIEGRIGNIEKLKDEYGAERKEYGARAAIAEKRAAGAEIELQHAGIEGAGIHAYQAIEKGVEALKEAERPRINSLVEDKLKANNPGLMERLFSPSGLIGGMAAPATAVGGIIMLFAPPKSNAANTGLPKLDTDVSGKPTAPMPQTSFTRLQDTAVAAYKITTFGLLESTKDNILTALKPTLETYQANMTEMKQAYTQAQGWTKVQIAAGMVASHLSGDLGDRQDKIKFDAKGPALLYVNGIRTDDDNSRKTTKAIERATEIKSIARIENNTHGIFGLADLLQIGAHEAGIVDITAIRATTAMRQGVIEKGDVYVIAHSQGTAVTNAALKLLTPAERRHVHYQGFGGQTFIDAPKQGLAEASNYREARDGVPYAGNDIKKLMRFSPALAALPGNYAMSAVLRKEDKRDWKMLSDCEAKGLDIINSVQLGYYHDMDRNYLNHIEKQWEKK